MKGYWIIFGSHVTDTEAQQEYGRLWGPIGEKYGAKVKVLDTSTVLKESLHTNRVLLVEFATYADAQACYADPAYVEAKAFATRASKREVMVIEGDLVF